LERGKRQFLPSSKIDVIKKISPKSKEIFIKSCAQAIPTYCMSGFLLPSTLEDDLQKMMNSFGWYKLVEFGQIDC